MPTTSEPLVASSPYRDFGYRVLAYLLDSVILAGLLWITDLVLPIRLQPMGFIAVPLYYVFFDSSPLQGTPGKWLVGLKITTLSGTRLYPKQAFLRYLAKLVTFFTLGIGFLLLLRSDKRQALHDRLTKTLVVSSDK
jgi:uncharacterized RDD family membrane protein YckC